MPKRTKTPPPFPTKDELLAFIAESPVPVTKKEIARAFHIRGDGRVRLKAMLKELRDEEALDPKQRKRLAPRDALPEVVVAEIAEIDPDGELIARPTVWQRDTPAPRIYMAPIRGRQRALAPGDRVLARVARLEDGTYEGRPIRAIGRGPRQVLGVYVRGERGGRIQPTERRARNELMVADADTGGAKPGELVFAEVKAQAPRLGLQQARIVERLGDVDSPRAFSLIAIHEHGLPTAFPEAALRDAAAAGPVKTVKTKGSPPRTDLRKLPLVTIDGADARDFDDAVWAEADTADDNPGGWHLIVAIADVAHYVRAGSVLDKAAYQRGNSAYFPDRVVPMLPEELSNGWCSLKPDEVRPCLAAHLWIDAQGRLRRHRFERGLMRSAARLTYEQVQAAMDGEPDAATAPLLDGVIRPLYGAFRALAAARQARGTLDLDIPERRVRLDDGGNVAAIEPRPRLDSHRLIEEFMITANVAAAETLEGRGQPCMYRIHDAPDPQKLEALRDVLTPLGLKLPRGQTIRPRMFAQILDTVSGAETAAMVSELVLRAQSQAAYAPRNIGHFGLALRRYAHFTSPIRRYADLLVHRALIAGLGLGPDGLDPEADALFEEYGAHISMTERRAQAAERDTMDRFTAAYLQDRVGAVFAGRVNGVTRFGLFVTLEDSGADGLVPISSLPDDYYDHDARSHSLVGRRWGRVYRLGARVRTRLAEANPISGGLILTLLDEDEPDDAPAPDRDDGWDPLRDSGGGSVSRGRRSRPKGANGRSRKRQGRRGRS